PADDVEAPLSSSSSSSLEYLIGLPFMSVKSTRDGDFSSECDFFFDGDFSSACVPAPAPVNNPLVVAEPTFPFVFFARPGAALSFSSKTVAEGVSAAEVNNTVESVGIFTIRPDASRRYFVNVKWTASR